MEKFLKILLLVLLILFFPISVEAKNIQLNQSYTSILNYYDDEIGDYKLKVKEAGVYKINVSFDGYFLEEDDTTLFTNGSGDMKVIISSGNREYEYYVPIGETKTFSVGLDKGNAYIEVEYNDLFDRMQSTIQVKKSGKNYSFSKAYNYVKKNKKSHMKIKKKKNMVNVNIEGVSHIDSHEKDGYTMGVAVFPNIQINKQGKSSYATFYLDGIFLTYSVEYMNDADLNEIVIQSGKNKMKFDLDYSKEKNRFNYKDYLYEDTCEYKCTLLKSYVNSNKDVDKLIKIVKSKNAQIKIKGENGAFYYIYLNSDTRKKWVDALNLYKKIQKKYN
ncbi:MAG: hypothetical protein K2J90_08770 [Lachnospiraceae bacterium]|nr:hypothetical protein [Lachnospiraceae bacterium]